MSVPAGTDRPDFAGFGGPERRAVAGVLALVLFVIGLQAVWGRWHGREVERLPTEERVAPPIPLPPAIDVNTADATELQHLPGIGPKLAARIVADRSAHGPYRTLADLGRVSGIGPKTLAKLADFLEVAGLDAPLPASTRLAMETPAPAP